MSSKDDLKADLEALIRRGGSIDDVAELVAAYREQEEPKNVAGKQESNKRQRNHSPERTIPSRPRETPPTPLRGEETVPGRSLTKAGSLPWEQAPTALNLFSYQAKGTYSQPGSVLILISPIVTSLVRRHSIQHA